MFVLAAAAFAADPRTDDTLDGLGDDPRIDAPIINGVRENEYPSAVGLGAAGFTLCSGSLITPRIVLTAAHCSADLPIELVIQLGSAFVGTDAATPDASLSFSGGAIHPDYQPLNGTDTGQNDVAVLFLAEDAPVAPVWFRTEPLKPNTTEGEEVVSVGWGLDEQNGSNVKRSAPLAVSELDPVFLISRSRDNENGANICSGDSGGPQYHLEADGTLVQWAVHSWGDVECLYESGSTRTDKVAQWNLGQVEEVHGTRDRCEIFGQYGDGVCNEDCDGFDLDCLELPDPQAAAVAEGCGCGSAAPSSIAATALLGLVLVGRRRVRREQLRSGGAAG